MSGGHIPWSKVDIWLQGFRSIWLSTTRPDGRPHCTPIWYWWDGENKLMYISTHETSVKVANLAQQSYVVLTAGNADDTIILEGTATQLINQADIAMVNDKWKAKYVDPYSGTQASILYPDTLVYRVNVHHVMVWEYGSISSRTDWHF